MYRFFYIYIFACIFLPLENGYVEYDEFLVLMKRWSTQAVDVPEEVDKTEDKTKETFKVEGCWVHFYFRSLVWCILILCFGRL